jgi:hypothetical protein
MYTKHTLGIHPNKSGLTQIQLKDMFPELEGHWYPSHCSVCNDPYSSIFVVKEDGRHWCIACGNEKDEEDLKTEQEFSYTLSLTDAEWSGLAILLSDNKVRERLNWHERTKRLKEKLDKGVRIWLESKNN